MSTVGKKGQPDLLLVIRCRWVPGPSVRAACMMENIDFFFFKCCWQQPDIVVMIAYSAGTGRVAPADQGKRLSFKPGAAVRHSWFLLTETIPCLLVCVWRGYSGFSIWAVDTCGASATEVFDLRQAFWKHFSIHSGLCCISSPLLRTNTDWLDFLSRSMTTLFWLCIFAKMRSESMAKLFFVPKQSWFNFIQNERIKPRWWSVQGHKKHQQPIWTPISSLTRLRRRKCCKCIIFETSYSHNYGIIRL